MPLVEQELLTLPQHLSSPPVFSGIRVTRSLVLCVCFVDRCLSFCHFSFGHCVCADGFDGPNCTQSKYTDKINISDTNVRHINIYIYTDY